MTKMMLLKILFMVFFHIFVAETLYAFFPFWIVGVYRSIIQIITTLILALLPFALLGILLFGK